MKLIYIVIISNNNLNKSVIITYTQAPTFNNTKILEIYIIECEQTLGVIDNIYSRIQDAETRNIQLRKIEVIGSYWWIRSKVTIRIFFIGWGGDVSVQA